MLTTLTLYCKEAVSSSQVEQETSMSTWGNNTIAPRLNPKQTLPLTS